jgi:cysteine desulfurase
MVLRFGICGQKLIQLASGVKQIRIPVLYFDNLATMQMHPQVEAAMLPFLGEHFGNPSSLHSPGRRAHEALEQARASVARLLNVQSTEIYLTPSGTHSNNTALLGRARFCEANGLGKHAVISTFEHASVTAVMQHLAEARGWQVDRVGPALPAGETAVGFMCGPDARVPSITSPERSSIEVGLESGGWSMSVADFESALRKETSIVSIAAVDPYSGAMAPVKELVERCGDRRIFFHSDAALLPGRVDLGGVANAVSALSISAHKFGGPKGAGALYMRRGGSLMPAVFGGGQEMGYFPGTERLADIVGLGAVAEVLHASSNGNPASANKLAQLQILLWQHLAPLSERWELIGPQPGQARLPGHVALRPRDGTQSIEDWVSRLSDAGIMVGTIGGALQIQFDHGHSAEDVLQLTEALNGPSS